MKTKTSTPRDRLDRLVDYGRKAKRYWWIIAGTKRTNVGRSRRYAELMLDKYK